MLRVPVHVGVVKGRIVNHIRSREWNWKMEQGENQSKRIPKWRVKQVKHSVLEFQVGIFTHPLSQKINLFSFVTIRVWKSYRRKIPVCKIKVVISQ